MQLCWGGAPQVVWLVGWTSCGYMAEGYWGSTLTCGLHLKGPILRETYASEVLRLFTFTGQGYPNLVWQIPSVSLLSCADWFTFELRTGVVTLGYGFAKVAFAAPFG